MAAASITLAAVANMSDVIIGKLAGKLQPLKLAGLYLVASRPSMAGEFD